MLPRYIITAFPPEIRARGDGYFTSRRARITRAERASLSAVVKGTTKYDIHFAAKAHQLIGSCTCPYAADYGICKHMWAALRQADSEQKIQPLMRIAGAGAEFRPRNERAVVEQTGDDSAFAGDDDEFGDIRPPKRSGPVPEWKTLLESAGRQMSSSSASYASPASTWPSDRRLVYIIDFAASRHSAGIVVELAMEREKADGSWELPSQLRVRRDAWQAVARSARPADCANAHWRRDAESVRPPSAPATSSFVLRGAALETTLWLMCETGRCRVRTAVGERPVDPIRWDDGSPWQFRLRVAPGRVGATAR